MKLLGARPSRRDAAITSRGDELGVQLASRSLPAVAAGFSLLIVGLTPLLVAVTPSGRVQVAVLGLLVFDALSFGLAAVWARSPRPIGQLGGVISALGSLAALINVFIMVAADRPELVACVILAIISLGGLVPQRRVIVALGALCLAITLPVAAAHLFSQAWVLGVSQLAGGWVAALLLQASRKQPLIELAAATATLHQQAATDELTGLLNRRGLFHRADALARATTASGSGVPVLFIDVDGLKTVNDTRGHTAGDELIRAAAGVLAYCAGSDDLLARIGGDEFVLLLTDDDVAGLVGRIEQQVAEVNGHQPPLRLLGRHRVPLPRGPETLSLSVGTSLWHPPQTSLTEVLDRADKAMYEHKRSRRSTPQLKS